MMTRAMLVGAIVRLSAAVKGEEGGRPVGLRSEKGLTVISFHSGKMGKIPGLVFSLSSSSSDQVLMAASAKPALK